MSSLDALHHALRKGIIEMMVSFSVLDHVPPSKKAQLDKLAVHFHNNHRHTFRRVSLRPISAMVLQT